MQPVLTVADLWDGIDGADSTKDAVRDATARLWILLERNKVVAINTMHEHAPATHPWNALDEPYD